MFIGFCLSNCFRVDYIFVRCQRFVTVCSNSLCFCSYSKRRVSNAVSLLSLGLVKIRGISVLVVCFGYCKIYWRVRLRCVAKRRQTWVIGSVSFVALKFKINGNVFFGRCEKVNSRFGSVFNSRILRKQFLFANRCFFLLIRSQKVKVILRGNCVNKYRFQIFFFGR